MRMYVGTYTRRGSEGIYSVSFDPAGGALQFEGLLARLENPSFLARHPRERILYSVCEGPRAGAVAAVKLNAADPDAAVFSRQSTLGSGPCHVAVDPGGRWLASANYGSGSVALHRLGDEGQIEPACDLRQHEGGGPVEQRQEGPHAHSVTFDPSGRYVIAADLGIDRLMLYRLDAAQGKLIDHQQVCLAAGSGPRHVAFDPSGRHAYVITELGNTVVTCRWDPQRAELTALQTVSTLPLGFTGDSFCADIHVHPNGRVLYGSNRGDDSLAIFTIDEAAGELTPAGHVPTGGEHPRNFTLTPDGNWLLVANQDSDNIVVFRVSADGTTLERTGAPFALPAPVCLLWE